MSPLCGCLDGVSKYYKDVATLWLFETSVSFIQVQ